ncbi:PP2C family protein-serine/threonine phosphatase, partial [Patescibacteria group bacterium]
IDDQLADLPVDEEPLPANIHDALTQIIDLEEVKKHKTYGVDDAILTGKLSEAKILPDKMYAYSGNENGSLNIVCNNILIAGFTDKGLRGYNEDGIFVDADSETLMVTDGVGSSGSGEVCSNIGIHVLAQLLKKVRDGEMKMFDMAELPTFLHRAVIEYKENNEKYKRTGATMVAAQVHDDKTVEFVHAGDSTAMLIRGLEVVWENEPDNGYQFLKENRDMSEAEIDEMYERINERDIDEGGKGNSTPEGLVQSLGQQPSFIDFKKGIQSDDILNGKHHTEQAQKGDIILLCSDGLTKTIGSEEVAKFIDERHQQGMALNRIAEELKEELKKRWNNGEGSIDNVTVLLAEIK